MAPMSAPKATTVDEYLATLPADKRAALQWLRRRIRDAAPGAEECISYGIPGFRLDGKLLVHFGAAATALRVLPGRGDRVLQGRARRLRHQQGHDSVPARQAAAGHPHQEAGAGPDREARSIAAPRGRSQPAAVEVTGRREPV